MSDDKKPEAFEAWIAWHPEQDRFEISISREGCEAKLTGVEIDMFGTYEKYKARLEAEVACRLDQGWGFCEVEVRPK